MEHSERIRNLGPGLGDGRGGGQSPPRGKKSAHYRRPAERPFTAEDRPRTTILVGNLTAKHEALLRAVFERSGYRIKSLPEPTKHSFRAGKEYCNNGLCNPLYYTAGALIGYLERLEDDGLTKAEIIDGYVYLTLSDCGPCRFGMYESQYRQALKNAGFDGFRVITTQLNRSSRTGGKQPGLQFSVDQWFGLVNALILGDLLYTIAYRLRPYEFHPGETDRAIAHCVRLIGDYLRKQEYIEPGDQRPRWLGRLLNRRRALEQWLNVLGKYRQHFYSEDYLRLLADCAKRLDRVQVDRTRVRPVVKIVGEFYSHLSESDANYKMFQFLEDEGAEVAVGTICGVLQYWFFKSKLGLLTRCHVDVPIDLKWWQLGRRARLWWDLHKKPLLFGLIDRLSRHEYNRINKKLGNLAPRLVNQKTLAETAAPYYRPLTRGGEGHLEVAEGIDCTTRRKCHMVLSLKPFGCMPSTQSDGVMAAVASHYEDMLFVSVETSGDSDINAYSRVQMVLSDAKNRAVIEYEDALSQIANSKDDIRNFIADRPELRRPCLAFRGWHGAACTAAQYMRHVSELMNRKQSWWRTLLCLVTANQGSISSEWTSVPRRSKQ